MGISSATFVRAGTAQEAGRVKELVRQSPWSAGAIFLAVISLGIGAGIRAIYQHSYNQDKKIDQYLRGNVGLWNEYLTGNVKINEYDQIQIITMLDGYPLTVTQTGTTEQPTLTYSYRGETSCTGDEGVFTTLDAWMLVQLSDYASDPSIRALYKDVNPESVQDNYFPDKLPVRETGFFYDFRHVDFARLAPDGITFTKVDFGMGALFTGANFEKITFANCLLPGAIFDGARMTTTHFIRTELWGASFMDTTLGEVTRFTMCHNLDKNKFPVKCDFESYAFCFATSFTDSSSTEYVRSNTKGKEKSDEGTFHFDDLPEEEVPLSNYVVDAEIKQLCDKMGMQYSEKLTKDDVSRFFRKNSPQHHPDKGGEIEKFKKLANERDTLIGWIEQRDQLLAAAPMSSSYQKW